MPNTHHSQVLANYTNLDIIDELGVIIYRYLVNEGIDDNTAKKTVISFTKRVLPMFNDFDIERLICSACVETISDEDKDKALNILGDRAGSIAMNEFYNSIEPGKHSLLSILNKNTLNNLNALIGKSVSNKIQSARNH